MTFNPKYVNRTSSMQITLTATTNLPIDTTIEIEFPLNYWTRDISTTSLPISSSMLCGSTSSVIFLLIKIHINRM